MNLRLTVLAVALLATACVSDKPPPLTRGQLALFISPAGEPFRGHATDPQYPVTVWFARVDTDHDGAISPAEFDADAMAFFKVVDANHDGLIDAFELGDYEQKIAPEILPRIARLTARDIAPLPGETAAQKRSNDFGSFSGGRRGGGSEFYGPTGEHEPIASADTDFDGKVSPAEMTAAAQRRFALLDKNHNGRLDRAEVMSPAEKLWAKAAVSSRP